MSLVAQCRSCIWSSSPAQVRSLCCSLSGFCTGRYSKWSWSGVFSFLLQVSLFVQFKRIIPALRCAGVALSTFVLPMRHMGQRVGGQWFW